MFLSSKPAGAMVFVTDPERPPLLGEGEIRVLFGLTPAEARLTRALAEGLDIARASHLFGVSIGTLRTRLKTIFEKTGTHRQVELIRVIVGSALCPRDREATGARHGS
jgi:DNA-binding CsgD family transcriptional regulator